MLKWIGLALLVPAIAVAGQDAASNALDPARQCELAVTAAERDGRLPARLLHAISLTESGRSDPASGHIRAWPWTINAEGEGHFFATRQAAIHAVRGLQARGVRSIDAGCMQVNLMYHPKAFASVEDSFDPLANALYAARFLAALYATHKTWPGAIGAYHSETPALGDAYRVMVLARWENPPLRDPPLVATAYRDFIPVGQVYGAFGPAARVYGAFTPPGR